ATAGQPPLGLLNPRIYPLIGTSNFQDVTNGSNGQFSAGVGYDRATGIGSPNMAVLLQTLTGATTGAPSVTTFNPTSGAVGTSVVISGVNLGRASAVQFNGVTGVITSATTTQVTATV